MKILYALLALALLKCIVFYKVYHALPLVELKRRARQKDHRAAALYKMVSYQASLDIFLWLLGTAAATVLVIWSARTGWWLAAIVVVVAAWLVVWVRLTFTGRVAAVVAFFAPLQARAYVFIHPVIKPLAAILPPGRRVHLHSGLYEKRDLLELLSRQNGQIDNRIPDTDLKIALNSLQFGDKTVGSVMTPRRQITFVAAGDSVGPKLVDELHKTGHNRFPVVKETGRNLAPQVIGILYLRDLSLDELLGKTGKVKDFMKRQVSFVNEDVNLRQALQAFLKSQHHLLIVVNGFEEVVGVLSLEDVIEQIIGRPIIDESDTHESLRDAAAATAQQEQEAHQEVKPEQTAETVVE